MSGGIRILLVDDDEDDALILRDQLAAGSFPHTWEHLPDYRQALELLLRSPPDIALIDYRLGGGDGLELIAEARREGVDVPMILLTGQGGEGDQGGQGGANIDLRALAYGAADYLVKGCDSHVLVRTLRYALERHHHSAALRDAEARYRMMFERSPLAMWTFDLETLRFLDVNRAAQHLYGFSREEFLAMDVTQVRPPGERERLLEALRRGHDTAPADWQVEQGYWRHQRRDGSQLFVETMGDTFQLDGRPAALVLIKDVSEQIEVQSSLERRERTLRQLIEDARDALLVVDEHGQVLLANPRAGELLASSPEALVGTRFAAPPEGSASDLTLMRENGSRVAVEAEVSRTEWEDQPARLVALRDVTQRNAAQERLALFNRAVESSSNGIIIADATAHDMPIIYANATFEAITGYDREEIIGSNCRFLQGSDTGQAELEMVRRALAQGQSDTVVLRNYRKDGTMFWNELTISPVRDEHGSVTHFLGLQNDITERKRLEQESFFRTYHDPLTGLPNRAMLEDRIHQAVAFCRRHRRALGVLFVDLDHFKPVNDSLGHHSGDSLLQQVAERLQRCVRSGDTVARMGSDEFVVVVPDLEVSADAAVVADKIMRTLETSFDLDGRSLYVTASIGISVLDADGDNAEVLLQHADIAMYAAKKRGRNTHVFYTPELEDGSQMQVTLRSELQRALSGDELFLELQPQVRCADGEVIGFEALVRWEHPERGRLGPDRFITVAEEAGLITPLGEWILRRACQINRRLIDSGLANVPVAVNISTLQFQRPEFVDTVDAVLRETGLPGERLELELTESVMMENLYQAVETLRTLNKRGVSVSIDDFGTGYSSLSYLKRLPIGKLKIDRSFVADVTDDGNDAAIVLAVIAMAQRLGVAVVAEGVETQEQLAFLARHGCEYAQGFYIGRPTPEHGLRKLLMDWGSRQ